MGKKLIAIVSAIVVLLALDSLDDVQAQSGVSIGRGMGTCDQVIRQIRTDWFELKRFMSAGDRSMARPRDRDFYCVDPGYTLQIGSREERPMSMSLRCYSLEESRFCCDKQLRSCAALQ